MTIKSSQHFLSLLLGLAVTLQASAGLAEAQAASQTIGAQDSNSSPPNVLIIYADDMGYGDMSCQNPNAIFQTPHLDRLAFQGLRLTDAHSSSGICTPSRYALLTGRYHWRAFHGIVNAMGQPAFDEGRVTLAHVLQDHGYDTAAIGKWHLGWDWAAIRFPDAVPIEVGNDRRGWGPESHDWSQAIPGGPLDRGFDEYFGDGTINFPPYCWIQDDRVVAAPTQMLDLGEAQTAEGRWECRPGPAVADWDVSNVFPTLIDATEVWLRERADDPTPYFCYFALPAPHAPIVPTEPFLGRSGAGGYGDFMLMVDDAVGRVLQALEDSGHADNTLVIFTSDNGPERYAFERARRYGHFSMGGLRGLKRDVWEGGHRVPFILRWPGHIEAGGISDALFGQIDLFATISAAAGVTIPSDAAPDSLNQLPLLRGNLDEDTEIRTSLVHNTFAGRWGLRLDDWVYLDGPTGTHSQMPEWFAQDQRFDDFEGASALLFDLAEDPGQRVNLMDQHPERARAMAALLAEIRDGGGPR